MKTNKRVKGMFIAFIVILIAFIVFFILAILTSFAISFIAWDPSYINMLFVSQDERPLFMGIPFFIIIRVMSIILVLTAILGYFTGNQISEVYDEVLRPTFKKYGKNKNIY